MIDTIRLGFFNSGAVHREPVECAPGLYWATLAVKPSGKAWQTVWTATGRDPVELVQPVLTLARQLAKALGSPLTEPDFEAYKPNLNASGNDAEGITAPIGAE